MASATLGLDAGDGALAILSTGLVVHFVFLSLFYPAREDGSLALFVLRWLHVSANLFVVAYPWVFDERYDGAFLVIWALLALSWFSLKSECILSFLEKKIIQPSYRLGADPHLHPYIKHIFVRPDGRERVTSLILPIAMHVVLAIVATRYVAKKDPPIWAQATVAVVLGIYVAQSIFNAIASFVRRRLARPSSSE